ncbi:MAG TPA: metallophosphoesterase [Candidatus Limnocylindria bacterium]|nr:metallophosphoesterase [Candidatus Limnocylindria bacterium]
MTQLRGTRAAGVLAVIAALAALGFLAAMPGIIGPGLQPSATGTAIGSGGPSAIITASTVPATLGPSLPPPTVVATPGATPGTTAATTIEPTLRPTAKATAKPTVKPTAKPSTPPSESDSVVLVGAGDIAVCGSAGDSATAALLDHIAGTVFTLGDNAYESGTSLEFENCYDPTWGRHFDRTRPSPGNHEYRTAGATGYFGYFGQRAGDPGKGYYAYDRGAWRIYSLNSNCEFVACGPASAQVAWLKDDMAANPHQCTLAYWHHPRYSSGRHGNDPSTDALWDALYDAGAEIVMAGHDHSYERFAPMDGGGDLAPGRGIVSFVVGTGGRDLYDFNDVLSTSRRRNATTWGVLKLTLSAGAWSSRFMPVAGKSFTDTASGTCH